VRLLHCADERVAEHDDHRHVDKEKVMLKNVGTVDRVIRVIAGLALIAASLLGYIGPWGWIGVVLLATGLFRLCTASLPFGLSTCPTKTTDAKP
jgi:hypothetical protein